LLRTTAMMDTLSPMSAMPMSPEADGFIPPWAEWDFNEWETCTDTDRLLVVYNYYSLSHRVFETLTYSYMYILNKCLSDQGL